MKFKLIDVRLSFPDLFEARQFEAGKGPKQYGAQFLMAPNGANYKTVRQHIEEAAKEKWPKNWQQILASIDGNPQKCCFIDGNKRTYDGYKDQFALSAKRDEKKGPPLVLDSNKANLTASSGRPYAGCYVDASVEIWAQDNQYGKAIRCTLLGVQFRRDGDHFAAGAVASEDDFDDLGDGANADASLA